MCFCLICLKWAKFTVRGRKEECDFVFFFKVLNLNTSKVFIKLSFVAVEKVAKGESLIRKAFKKKAFKVFEKFSKQFKK